jgi:pimeloyl-ACP methyl ester carboxylesterase
VETSLENLFFQNGDVRLHAIAAGPERGPIVVLLHGFPEFWYSWHKQIEPLAAVGFRVIVPDQRGYNLSSKPAGIASYALPQLVADVIAIADQLGQQKIYLAGHDWGAVVAWSRPWRSTDCRGADCTPPGEYWVVDVWAVTSVLKFTSVCL